MNKAKYQIGQTIISEDGKGTISKIFETTAQGYLYEVVRDGKYEIYLENELEPLEIDKKKTLEEMSKEELLDIINTYSNYVDINSKMNKVSIMNISEYINSKNYRELSNQKDEISKQAFTSIKDCKDEENQPVNSSIKESILEWVKNCPNLELLDESNNEEEDNNEIPKAKNLPKVIKIIPGCNINRDDFKHLKLDNHLSSFFYKEKNSTEKQYDIFKFNNDLKIGDKVIILTSNLKGTIVEIDRRNKLALVFVPKQCKTYGANIRSVRKIKDL